MYIRHLTRCVWICVLVTSDMSVVHAQTYPTKPIRVIVPFAAGGGSEKMAPGLGQPLIVDNRPGASGNVGITAVAKAPPDGYTMLVMSSNFAVNPSLYAKAGYDPVKDFEPISGLTSYMFYLVVHPSLPPRSVKALIALAKANPGKLTYASAGIATGGHFAAEMFNVLASVKLTHVPYKGVAPGIVDTIGGQVSLMFGVPEVVPHVKTGRLTLLAVTGSARSPAMPAVPTVAESGLPGFDVTSWHSLFAPAGTPASIVKRLNDEVKKSFGVTEVADIFRRKDMDLAISTPQELGALVKTTQARWSKVIRDVGIKVE
jgi:tripartite-type tricarboxylate transporter receptor subunit TctC